jgi:hypothetical protein
MPTSPQKKEEKPSITVSHTVSGKNVAQFPSPQDFNKEIMEEFEKKFPVSENRISSHILFYRIEDFLSQALSQVRQETLKEIKEKLPKEMINTKEESDSDWFYGLGFNACLSDITTLIDEQIQK